MVRDTKLYDELGVSPNANESEAYRKLSVKWHQIKIQIIRKKLQKISE